MLLLPAVAAAVIVTVTWLRDPQSLDEVDAAATVSQALDAIGVIDAHVRDQVEAGVFLREGSSPEPVWRATAEVEGGRIELWLSKANGTPVFVDDRSDDGSRHLLTDGQFAQLEGFRPDDPWRRALRRNVLVTIAAAAIAATAAVGHSVRQ